MPTVVYSKQHQASESSPPAFVMSSRTARRTMCHDWAFKGCKVQPGFQFSPALREWESVGIQLRPLGNAAYVAYLPLLYQGSKWLNGNSAWLVFRRSWVWIPAGSCTAQISQIFKLETKEKLIGTLFATSTSVCAMHHLQTWTLL